MILIRGGESSRRCGSGGARSESMAQPPPQRRGIPLRSLLATTTTTTLLLLLLLVITPASAEFNYEVEKRVLERIDEYLNGPRIANGITDKIRTNGGFPHNMDARDRNAYLTFSYSLMQQFKFDLLYFGLEDGTFLGYVFCSCVTEVCVKCFYGVLRMLKGAMKCSANE